jgi:methyl-accepting chemotaxis protein
MTAVSISIANRILLGFALITAMLIGIGIYALNQVERVSTTATAIATRDVSVINRIEVIREAERQMRDSRQALMNDFLLRSSGRVTPQSTDWVAQWRKQASQADVAIADTVALLAQYRSQARAVERVNAWTQIGQRFSTLATDMRQLQERTERQFAAVAANDLTALQASDPAYIAARDTFFATLALARTETDRGIDTGRAVAEDIYATSYYSVLISIGVAAVFAGVISMAIRGSIVGPLAEFMAFVARVGRGDLTVETQVVRQDELGRLGETLNTMVLGLRNLAKQGREATENLNAAAAEIRASTQEQSASVEEQLAAVQETAATVDEITHAGSQIGKRAQEVIASAQATALTSTAGLRAVEETARAMDAIREQGEAVAENIVALSEKTIAIGEIIATVNDVSERSHLLALNAAIEAAAAGESGRSFAIVAAEMKVLADQAKEATTQVRSLLGDIQRGINSSVMLAEEAVKRVVAGKERTEVSTRTIEEITSRVQEGVQTFQQIVASTNQQQLGIEQVMAALQNIRQASQQTAAGTRQLDSAASNLSGLSQQLLSMTDQYRI